MSPCHPSRRVWRDACSELRLPAARAGGLKEAVTMVPPGLRAEILIPGRDRLQRVVSHAVPGSRCLAPEQSRSSPSCRAGMAAQVTVLCSPRCLFDEPVQIRVAGLQPRQAVTLRASLVDESGELFQAHALYRAGSSGELDLSRSPALGGSYLGVEPMGLFWALQSKSPYKRLAKRNVLTPFYVDLEVYEGHGDMSRLLGKCTNERWFLGEGVKRISVREGRLKATLFLPPGEF